LLLFVCDADVHEGNRRNVIGWAIAFTCLGVFILTFAASNKTIIRLVLDVSVFMHTYIDNVMKLLCRVYLSYLLLQTLLAEHRKNKLKCFVSILCFALAVLFVLHYVELVALFFCPVLSSLTLWIKMMQGTTLAILEVWLTISISR